MLLPHSGMFRGEQQSLCPHFVRCLRIMHLDHLLEPRGFVHMILMLSLLLSLAFGFMWGADVAQLYCLQSVPWNEGISSLGCATCLWEALGCILFLRNAVDMILFVANYDQDGDAMLIKRRNKLHLLMQQCKDILVRVKNIMSDMLMTRVEDIASTIKEHMEDQQDILVELKNSLMDVEQGNWTSTDAQKVFHTLVIQMADYVDEPNRLATSLQLMTPQKGEQCDDQKGEQCDDEADLTQDENMERMELIVRLLLSNRSLTDQQNPVIESLKSNQFWSCTRLKWLRDALKRLASRMFFCLSSVCMWEVLTMARNRSSRALVVLDEDDDQKEAMLTRNITKNVSNDSVQSLPQDVGLVVLAPVRTAIRRINHINIPEDREYREDAKALRWFGIGNNSSVEQEDSAADYPQEISCYCFWIQILSRVHFRLLLGMCMTFIYLLFYALIFKRLFDDIFVIEDSKCQEKTWECKVALIRRLFGIATLVSYLGTIAVILWHFDRFDRVMQIEMDILELQDFKTDIEALDSGMFGASHEANNLLDEVKARLKRRQSIMRKFRRNQRNRDLPSYKDLSKRLAASTEEPQEPDRSRRGSRDWSFPASRIASL